MVEFEIEEWEGRGWMLHADDVFLGFYESREVAQSAANWLASQILAHAILHIHFGQYLN